MKTTKEFVCDQIFNNLIKPFFGHRTLFTKFCTYKNESRVLILYTKCNVCAISPGYSINISLFDFLQHILFCMNLEK